MNILASFCNQPQNSLSPNLALINYETEKVAWIYPKTKNKGFTGLSQNNKFIFAIYQSTVSGIIVLNKESFEIVLEQELKELTDPHSITADDANNLYVVSTGTDSVIRYIFDKDKNSIEYKDLLWKPKYSKGTKDTHHINSITIENGNIYISAFGKKKGKLWSTAKDGYVFNITHNEKVIENIYHPHSLKIHNKEIYSCESSSRSIKQGKNVILTIEKGYTRGLEIINNYLILGTSSGRKKSKSTKLINNITDKGLLIPSCNVQAFRLDRKKKIKEFNFLPEHKEIYDIIVTSNNLQDDTTQLVNTLQREIGWLKSPLVTEEQIKNLTNDIKTKNSELRLLKEELNERGKLWKEELEKRDNLTRKEISIREKDYKNKEQEIKLLKLELKKRGNELKAEMRKRENIWKNEVKQREQIIKQRDREIEIIQQKQIYKILKKLKLI